MTIKFAVLILATFCTLPYAHAEVGVSDAAIKIGVTRALTGPLGFDGSSRRDATEAYINRINAAGGVHGRKLEVISLDDGYEPNRAVENTRKLIQTDQVFTLFDFQGSPTVKAVIPIIDAAKVVSLGPVTGGFFTRSPMIDGIFNVRAGYEEEAATMVKFIVTKLKVNEIGLVIQDDALGTAGAAGVQKALHASGGLKLKAEANYKRNTNELDPAVQAMKSSNVKAVIFWGVGSSAPEFLKRARAAGIKAEIFLPSPASSPELLKQAGPAAEGIYLTQVVPFWNDTTSALVRDYEADMKTAGKTNINPYGLESYLNAVVLVDALKRAGKELTRASYKTALENLHADFGGFRIDYGTKDRIGGEQVFLAHVEKGKPSPQKGY